MSKIFLITAPSGAGKTTIAQAVANYGDWTECISHTSRPIRDGEVDGKTYYFKDKSAMADMIENDEFAEYVKYDGNFYGITKAEIERVTKTGRDVFIIVEYDGFMQIKKLYPDAIGIFLHMKKEDCLANMLLRGDSMDKALSRIKLYDEEMARSISYEYVIKNVRGRKYETENVVRAIVRQHSDNTIHINTNPFITPSTITSKDTISSTWK